MDLPVQPRPRPHHTGGLGGLCPGSEAERRHAPVGHAGRIRELCLRVQFVCSVFQQLQMTMPEIYLKKLSSEVGLLPNRPPFRAAWARYPLTQLSSCRAGTATLLVHVRQSRLQSQARNRRARTTPRPMSYRNQRLHVTTQPCFAAVFPAHKERLSGGLGAAESPSTPPSLPFPGEWYCSGE